MPSPHSQPPAGQQARLLQTHTPELFANAVAEVVEALRKGEVVALPTETVYGLAANAWNPEAVRRIYEAKGRPAHNPIILHVVGKPMARMRRSFERAPWRHAVSDDDKLLLKRSLVRVFTVVR